MNQDEMNVDSNPSIQQPIVEKPILSVVDTAAAAIDQSPPEPAAMRLDSPTDATSEVKQEQLEDTPVDDAIESIEPPSSPMVDEPEADATNEMEQENSSSIAQSDAAAPLSNGDIESSSSSTNTLKTEETSEKTNDTAPESAMPPPPPRQTANDAKKRSPFTLLHQSLSLDIGVMERQLCGVATLHIAPRTADARLLCVNARQFVVRRVTVNGEEVAFEQLNVLEKLVPDDNNDFALDSYAERLAAAQAESDLGELRIQLDDRFIQPVEENTPRKQLVDASIRHLQRRQHRLCNAFESFNKLDDDAPEGKGYNESSLNIDERFVQKFHTLIVAIEYELIDPVGGAHFVLPTEKTFKTREPHMFTDSRYRSARCWMPCFDSLVSHCTWSIECRVESKFFVVSSGELQSHRISADNAVKTFVYEMATPTRACDIALAVGPFVVAVDPKLPATVTYFCLPRHRSMLLTTIDVVVPCIVFCEKYLRLALPYGAQKFVFIDEAVDDIASHASLTLCSTSLLHTPRQIERSVETKRLLARAVAQQWFGSLISAPFDVDAWLYHGAALHVARTSLESIVGMNSCRFWLIRMSQLATSEPPMERASPYSAGIVDAAELADDEAWQARAALVFHLLERKWGNDVMQRCLCSLFTDVRASRRATQLNTENRRATVKASDAEDAFGNKVPPKRCWTTCGFMFAMNRVTRHEMRAFALTMIHGGGHAPLRCGFVINRRRWQLEFAMRMVFDRMKQDDADALLVAVQSLNIRVCENDATYEHNVILSAQDMQLNIPWYGRGRARRRRMENEFLEPGAHPEYAGYVQGYTNVVPVEPLKSTGPGFSMNHIADIPVRYVHVDPTLEHLAPIRVWQPAPMWRDQACHARDILAQLKAIGYLDPINTVSLAALEHILLDERIFHRVRAAAAVQLARGVAARTAENVDPNWRALEALLNAYKSIYCDDMIRPRPNNFRLTGVYRLQKTMIWAIARVRDEQNRSPNDVAMFVLALLEQNDNSLNNFDDAEFVAILLKSAGALRCAHEPGLQAAVIAQIERYLQLERFLPSFDNAIGAAAVAALSEQMLARQIPINRQRLLIYSRCGNSPRVRRVALNALISLSIEGSSATTRAINETALKLIPSQPPAAPVPPPSPSSMSLSDVLNIIEETPASGVNAQLKRDFARQLIFPNTFEFQVDDQLYHYSPANSIEIGAGVTTVEYKIEDGDLKPGQGIDDFDPHGIACRIDARIEELQRASKGAEEFARTLWRWLNSSVTAYDARLRCVVMRAYERAFGTGTPAALKPQLMPHEIRHGAERLVPRVNIREKLRRAHERPAMPQNQLISMAATAMYIPTPQDLSYSNRENSSYSSYSNADMQRAIEEIGVGAWDPSGGKRGGRKRIATKSIGRPKGRKAARKAVSKVKSAMSNDGVGHHSDFDDSESSGGDVSFDSSNEMEDQPQPKRRASRSGRRPRRKAAPKQFKENDDEVEAYLRKEEERKNRGSSSESSDTESRSPVRKPARKSRAVAAPVVEQEVIQEWVQCSTCEKWHELPQYIKPDSLPDEWFCSMNNWSTSPKDRQCAALPGSQAAVSQANEVATQATAHASSTVPSSTGIKQIKFTFKAPKPEPEPPVEAKPSGLKLSLKLPLSASAVLNKSSDDVAPVERIAPLKLKLPMAAVATPPVVKSEPAVTVKSEAPPPVKVEATPPPPVVTQPAVATPTPTPPKVDVPGIGKVTLKLSFASLKK